MKKFKQAYLPKVSPEEIATQFSISLEEAERQIKFIDSQEVYLNDIYQVNIDRTNNAFIW